MPASTGVSPTNYRPMKQQVSCQKAAGVSYSNQQRLQNAFGEKAPQCGQSRDVGTVCPFPRSKKAKLLTVFSRRQAAAICQSTVPPSAADQPCDCCVPVLNRIGPGLAIVPATIAHAAALPAFGHAELGWDASAPNRSNNLRAVQVGIVAALLTAGNAK
jgi:hypothetical protein